MNARRSYPGKAAFVIVNPKSSLMDQVREVLRVRHYSLRTEEAYTGWVVGFLNHLASVKAVSAATQNQALNAIVFLYS